MSAVGPVSLQPCKDGPVLVRGATHVVGPDGVSHPVRRSVVAVCRCGKSALSPWCDGTHKVLRKTSTSSA